MAYNKKTWTDRVAQYPNRRKITDTSTSVQQTVNVIRDEGTITTVGDVFDASTMNDLETRIDNAFNNINFPVAYDWLQTVTPTITRTLCGNTTDTNQSIQDGHRIHMAISYSNNRCLYYLTPQINVTNYNLMLVIGYMSNNYGVLTTQLGVNVDTNYYSSYTESNYTFANSTGAQQNSFIIPINISGKTGNQYINLTGWHGSQQSSYTCAIDITNIILL